MSKELADLLFPDVKRTPEDMEKLYPKRELSENSKVTRIGPSPTGFVHLGNLYNAIIAERLAHQSEGIFYLRIEDTDNKREVSGAVETIITAMKFYGIQFDEGAVMDGDRGSYGPYRQRQRKDIYHVFAKVLVERGLAYPCFCSEDTLKRIRETQMQDKKDLGYYGSWASCKSLTLDEIKLKLKQGDEYVLRFRADANETYITVKDDIRGSLTMPANRLDFVLLKSDGIPTYHFAHVVDDHLMRTTHVIRGEEWIPSLPMHIQLFDIFGWKEPHYCHTATLMKMDGTSKRKLSKRKDPELALSYYQEEGYLPEALWFYILTILNSNFEEWAKEHQQSSYLDYTLALEKMSNSGALFDIDKLNDISKEMISRMSAEEVYDKWLSWIEKYHKDYAACLQSNKEMTIKALQVGRTADKIRKDLSTWKQTCTFMSMYFDEFFCREDEFDQSISLDDRNTLISLYSKTIDFTDDKNAWFDKVKYITDKLGFAVNIKEYKKNKDHYKGSIVDITNILRIAITGRSNAPDLWEVSMVIGENCVRDRLQKTLNGR
ncbi:MAG: Glutamyl/glutaminyl-tRNA synthetase, class Ic, catalytic domain [Herbinix sp.]|nr:Glutamyl/glutaminyl-tRNA synthetase, class Ic, catalytic domain [Herbinix sp.]